MIKCENACPRGKFDGCCHKCPDFHTCPDSCQENPNACGSATFDEETALQEFKNTQLATLNAIASLTAHKKAIEDQEKEMKAKLKKKYPDIASECSKTTAKAGYVKITLKGDKS